MKDRTYLRPAMTECKNPAKPICLYMIKSYHIVKNLEVVEMNVVVIVNLGDKELAKQFAEHFDQLNYASKVELDGERVRLHVKTEDWERLKEEGISLQSLIEQAIASVHPAGWAYVQNHDISSMIDVEIAGLLRVLE